MLSIIPQPETGTEPETQHIDYLDGWRGISILLLLAGHFSLIPSIAGYSFYTGRVGVECFFVLSGLLMAEILFVRKTPIGLFYWRRASRILPALWVFIGTICIAAQFAKVSPVSFLDAISALTFTINYRPGETGFFRHIWSLCVEEHAYVVLSIIAVLHRRFAINVPVVLGSISLASILNGMIQTWALHRDYHGVYWHSDVRMASVFMSAALYLQLGRHRSIHPAVPIVAGMIGFAVSVFNFPDPIKYSAGTFLLAVGLLAIDLRSMVARI